MSLIVLELVTKKEALPNSRTFGRRAVYAPVPGVVHVAEPVRWGADEPKATTLCGLMTQYMQPRPDWRIEPGWSPPRGRYCTQCRNEAEDLLGPP
jgi:hypothetical protein